jgi:predicted HTH transcriptional regulator
MEMSELVQTLSRGEDSRTQFKRNFNNSEALAAEMIAFSNGEGGTIFIGVEDSGVISGISSDDIRRLNQMISNVASQHILPAINPTTENIDTGQGLVLVIYISKGINKPYQDKSGTFWVKSGADKRKAASREEIQRMFQQSGLLHADEVIVPNMSISDIDIKYFSNFFQKYYGESLEEQDIPLSNILGNMNLMKEGCLNLSGALLFSENTEHKLPVCRIKAVVFIGNDISGSEYLDSREITGKLEDIYQNTIKFIISSLRRVQGGQGFNSIGILEILKVVFEELVVNALVHRNYFISAPSRVLIFDNRIEIISPGVLPNNLTIENIKYGNSNIRNPVLTSYATHILPYKGIGSGIKRALKEYPHIKFTNDKDGNLFTVTIKRPELKGWGNN